MSPKPSRFGLVVALTLTVSGVALAQAGGNPNQGDVGETPPVKPTGPAAKKADDLIRAYTGRIEKEIDQGRKDVERLRAELHELIDVRYAMTEAIAELRGDLATKGVYSTDPVAGAQPATEGSPRRCQRFGSIATSSTEWEVRCQTSQRNNNASSFDGSRLVRT